MYDQIREDTLFTILFSIVTAMAAIASCYLLLRRGNAFAADITPPVRLRRWAAAFFASLVLNHVWYMSIFFLHTEEAIKRCDLLGGVIDSLTFFPLAVIVMLTMLQDRRRPLWPVAVVFVPFVVGNVYCAVSFDYSYLPVLYVYFLLVCIGFIVYMVRAVRQYGRWLRDNYADLEHKEVWQSFLVLAGMLLSFVLYAMTSEGTVYIYVLTAISMVLICYLLWRVETLSDLSFPQQDDDVPEEEPFNRMDGVGDEPSETTADEDDDSSSKGLSQANCDNIRILLKQRCIDSRLYLQHDLTLLQLAKAIGTNRFYLSQYFSMQGTTYNAYINDLRVNHFVNLYHESIDVHRSFTAQQLAQESGFRSYSTFSSAFKRKTNLSVTAWIRAHEGQEKF